MTSSTLKPIFTSKTVDNLIFRIYCGTSHIGTVSKLPEYTKVGNEFYYAARCLAVSETGKNFRTEAGAIQWIQDNFGTFLFELELETIDPE